MTGLPSSSSSPVGVPKRVLVSALGVAVNARKETFGGVEVARLHLGEVGVHDRPVVARVVVEVEHPLELQLVRRRVEGGLEEHSRRAALLGAVRLVDDHREAEAVELEQHRDVLAERRGTSGW